MGLFGNLFKKISSTELAVKELWKFDVGATISAAPLLIDKEGVYGLIATHEGKLYAFDHGGQQLWTYDSGEQFSVTESFFVDKQKINSITDTPVIQDVDGDGKLEIVFSAVNGTVHCVSMQGQLKWKYETGGPCYGAPLVTAENGNTIIVAGSHDKCLYKLNGQGRILHKQEVGFKIENKPAHVENLILIGGHEGEVCALNMQLQPVWTMHTEARVTAPITGEVLTEDNHHVIIVGSQDGKLYALNTKGETLWTFRTKGAIISAPLISDVTGDDSKDIIVGSCDNTIYCIDAFGELNWSYETDFWVVASPLSSTLSRGNTQVVAASYDQKLYILEGQGTYALSYIPGLSGIVNQTGQHANILAKEAGESKGKKLYDYTTSGAIVGCVKIDDELFVTTKHGNISCYRIVH